MTSKEFHRKTKSNIRKKRFRTLAGAFDNAEKQDLADRIRYPLGVPSAKGTLWLSYINFSLSFWQRGIDTFTPVAYPKMSFDKYVNTQKVMDKLANAITDMKPSIVFVGAVEFSPNAPIKKHIRCPGTKRIVKSLKKQRDTHVVFTDEYNSSKHCSKCVKAFPKHTYKHKFKICNNCPGSSFIPNATAVHTKIHREERIRRICRGLPQQKTITFNKIMQHPHTIIWHRDITAARLIWLKGEFLLIFSIIFFLIRLGSMALQQQQLPTPLQNPKFRQTIF